MSIALRALMLLAAGVTLFVATGFHPAWWQIFLAAAVGSALGQAVVRLTRRRRAGAWVALGATVTIIGAALAWYATRPERPGAAAAVSAQDDLIVVANSTTLTWEDVQALETLVAHIQVVPVLRTKAQLSTEEQNWATNLQGTTPAYFEVLGWPTASGSTFSDSSIDTNAKIVVLGQTVAQYLFGEGTTAVGQTIRIGNTPFEVVGVLSPRGQSSEGQDYDDVAIIPLKVYRARFDLTVRSSIRGAIFIKPDSPDQVDRVEAKVTNLLRDRHRLVPEASADFTIRRWNPEAASER